MKGYVVWNYPDDKEMNIMECDSYEEAKEFAKQNKLTKETNNFEFVMSI